MGYDIYFNLKFNIKGSSFEIDTNIKPEKVKDIVNDFLRSQIGQGKDHSEVTKQDIYEIEFRLDFSDDTYLVTHNCGNKGLREGILAHYLQKVQTK